MLDPVTCDAERHAAGVLIAVVSTVAPLSAAEDTSTGVLLAAMHLPTGAAFAITALTARL